MIEFSDHAKERNLKRKIPKNWIIKTVKEPEEILNSFRGRKLRRKKFGDKILEVVTTNGGNKITVITQYYLGEKNES
ncbi:DUF4258 domain-containing protein [Candidatus Gottesmanbacteria bacterium]|nr:DUF4258 domain-containing protein [Candidatus Gottesmanbacteria bacterium]MBI5452408.1 DUF4258 domain-containing protein [Candidatus Gottesmanbacteria bacterium]